ncbi:hypothetical protein Vadar_020333 [Vaccinium darrowii]|uniref:Uncharacterized protein n=1 Tax=Vaccinium darrowii TaxID=229202 RepID=A0ACB7Y181_9ERIC|nr:hypothetical protein Vadar_020333 [Vaccinium darrowii]
MAFTLHHNLILIFFYLFSLIAVSVSQTRFKPDALVLPVQKDTATGLHVAQINTRTPLISVPFLVDLNGLFLWVNCDQHYFSSTYKTPFCGSTQYTHAMTHYCNKCPGPSWPGCHNNTCGVVALNTVTRQTAIAELAQEVLSIQSTRAGSNPGPSVNFQQFLFACAPSSLLQGPLPKNVQGIAGFGHTPISLPTQLTAHFGLSPKFALCLISSPVSKGVIFLGNGPYKMLPNVDISARASYTPMTVSPQAEYFIQVSSIKINGKPLPLNLSATTKQGVGGTTMISTTTPYTSLEHSIFTTFTQFFATQLSAVPQVRPVVQPFGVCFDSTKLSSTRVGLGVPTIDFVMRNDNVAWSFYGANSMVQARPGVACLAFVDGGVNPKASVVIGAH